MPSLRQLFLHHLAQTSDFPMGLEVKRAEGVYIYDQDDTPYLDLISGIGVSALGHRHPAVMQAITDQLHRYTHVMVYGEFISAPQVQLSRALSETLPDPLSVAYLVNSGSEAIEGALKLAKKFTGKPKLVSCMQAYHGSTHGALSVSGSNDFKQGYGPFLPQTEHIPFNDTQALEIIDQDTAAFLIETVQGEAGVQVPDTAYLRAAKKRCEEMGALFILDEIQAGFGRTGSFWAFENYQVVPDILVTAKGMGGGMPIGAFISSPEIMDVLRRDPVLGHITTFGGHPVSAAASLATLRVIQKEKLYQQAVPKAQLFKKKLRHPAIREIRNKGLMMAIEFDSFEVVKPIIDRCLQLGMITDWFLYCNRALRIAPPLLISEGEIEKACRIILQAIEETS